MTILAQSIIRRVVETLQDPTSIRWPVSELARYFNDGQRAVAMYRPDAAVKTATISLAPGTVQSLPAEATKLVKITHNTGERQRVVTKVPVAILDAQLDGWRGQNPVTEILHFMYDVREPRQFENYPPAASGARVQATYAFMPADIAEPQDGLMWSNVQGVLGLPDVYSNAVQNYILHRCYMKDAEYAENAARAQAHKAAFAEDLQVEIAGTIALAPVTTRAQTGA